MKNKLKDFNGSHANYLIAEAMRIKLERELKAKEKEEEEVKALLPKPDISSKYFSRRTHSKVDREDSAGPEGTQKRKIRSPQVEVPVKDKWDWLYKVGVQKVMEKAKAGRNQEDIIIEREPQEYTFKPN